MGERVKWKSSVKGILLPLKETTEKVILEKHICLKGGLNELVSEGVLVSDPVPTWLTSLPTAGRNKLTLVSNPRKETEFELESLISRTSNKSRF